MLMNYHIGRLVLSSLCVGAFVAAGIWWCSLCRLKPAKRSLKPEVGLSFVSYLQMIIWPPFVKPDRVERGCIRIIHKSPLFEELI